MGASQIPKRTGEAVTGTLTLLSDSANHDVIPNIGIVVALPEELSSLTSHKLKQGDCCQIGGSRIIYSGAGWQNAAAAAQILVDKGVRQLISWGCAAGLSDTLNPGDLVLATRIISEQQEFDTDDLWRQQIQQRLATHVSIHEGKLFSSAEIIGSSLLKQRIRQQSQAIALDMESAAIAETALRAHLPCLVIRSIADPVSQDLPLAVLRSLNAKGQVELPRLLRHLFWHPWETASLIRLGLNFRAAHKTLKTVARELRLQESINARQQPLPL